VTDLSDLSASTGNIIKKALSRISEVVEQFSQRLDLVSILRLVAACPCRSDFLLIEN
jgi:hypothetical protein